MLTRRGSWLSVLATALLVIGVDQVTKHIANSTLTWDDPLPIDRRLVQLQLVENKGWILSLGHAQPEWVRRWAMTVGCVCVLMTMTWAAFVLRARGRPFFGVALILAGAGSNVFDHVATGVGIDFIALHLGSRGGVAFNVADLAIAIGLVLLYSAPGSLPDTEFRWPFTRQRGTGVRLPLP